MSGGSALQQRTTYLISLTLVKVEAVEENGGEARNSSQGKDMEGGQEIRRREEVSMRVETGGVLACTENRAGVVLEEPQKAHDTAIVKGSTNEFKDEERKPLSPLRGNILPNVDVGGKNSETQPSNLSIPFPSERVTIQKTKSTDIIENILPMSEAKHSTSPLLTTTPPTEVVESSCTQTMAYLPIRPAGQQPESLLKSHSSVITRGRDSREGKERSPTSAQSLDRKDCRVLTHSPGPCRASWAEASQLKEWRDAKDGALAGMPVETGVGMVALIRDIPRKERLKTGSTSLPAPTTQVPKPTRKDKSRTLDNSDLNSLSEDLGLAREAQQAQQGQRGTVKDRKMLKFISGIFTKSSYGAVGPSTTAPPVYIQRDSSEEEGRRL